MFKKYFEKLAFIINPWEEFSLDGKGLSFSNKIRVAFKKIYLWSQKTTKIRYLPVLNELYARPQEYKSILEVGSGALGLSRYTRAKIIGLDILTSGPHYNNMTMIGSSAVCLPFKDASFDLVVSVDMLEHIPVDLRAKVIFELIRVCKKDVFLGVPVFEYSAREEERIKNVYLSKVKNWKGSEYSKNKFIKRNLFIVEHEKCGLPKIGQVRGYIESCRPNNPPFKTEEVDNESLIFWRLGVLGDMKYSYLRWFFTSLFFIIFFFLVSRVKWGGCYRKIFIIRKKAF